MRLVTQDEDELTNFIKSHIRPLPVVPEDHEVRFRARLSLARRRIPQHIRRTLAFGLVASCFLALVPTFLSSHFGSRSDQSTQQAVATVADSFASLVTSAEGEEVDLF